MEPIPPDAETVRNARRRYGTGGSIVAAIGIGIDEAVFGKPKRDQGAVVVDAPGEPGDLDRDGITMTVNAATAVTVPAQPPRPPLPPVKVRRRRR